MASTITAKIAPLPRGDYSSSATYDKLDIVSYNGSSYMAIKAVPTGTVPTNTTYWQLLAEKPTIGDGSITTDMLADGAVTDAKLAQTGIKGTTSDGAFMSLDNIVPYGFRTTDGGDSPAATNFWNTGLIWIGEGRNTLNANFTIYKTAFYGIAKDFISSDNTHTANVPIPQGAYYIKVQFKNSVVSYSDASTVKLYVTSGTVINKLMPNGIEKNDLSESLVTDINKIDGIGDMHYDGERIRLGNRFDYGFLFSTDIAYPQAGAIYGDYLFCFTKEGDYRVYNLKGVTVTDRSLPSGVTPHCNVAFFGNEKYADTDTYPLLYVNAYNAVGLPKGTCYAYRMSDTFYATLVQTITVGFTSDPIWTDGSGDIRPYGNFFADTDNGYLYAYTLLDTSKVTRFFKFRLPKLADGDVTFTTADILEYWDCEYFKYIQDNAFYDGKVYILSGFGTETDNGYLRVVDTVRKKQVSLINLNNTLYKKTGLYEPELISIYDGAIILGAASNIYKLLV